MTAEKDSIPVCPPPDPNPTTPIFNVPAGACDTHAHLFTEAALNRYSDKRGYTPPIASIDSFRSMHKVLGIERAVLTQPSVYGTDNTAILEAVARHSDTMRAVVAVGNDVTEKELERLNESGVKGVRVNIVDKGGMPFNDLNDVKRFTERIAQYGWHLEFLLHAQDFPEMRKDFGSLPVNIVVGHLGYMKTSYGLDNPGFNELLAMTRDGKCWVKLTGSYRITGEQQPPYNDVIPYGQALVSAAPNRMLWGSDWPHPSYYG
ncbi:MAG: amidohydrolase family protein, partial [Burkholderiaceae bacterium]